ncbi:MAG TPA: hypothetical protein VJT31_22815 [Rugosimonospora sp.]|nr:hypothetical protein [Rugosimonospora sp.]
MVWRGGGVRIPARLAAWGVVATLVGGVAGVASAGTQPAARGVAVTRAGILPFRTGAAAQAAAGDLTYHGGYIQDHVAVYLVFWGSQWTSDTTGVQTYVTNFFTGLGTTADAWSRVTSQYTGTGGAPTFTGPVLQGGWVDGASAAPADATAADIATEAERAAAHFGVAAGHNLSVIVLSPQGTHPDGFPNSGWCAWHSSSPAGVPYTNLPYVLDAGASCGENSVGGLLDGFSVVGGHEYAETVTDPFPDTGWVDASGAENADKCAWQNLHTIALPSGTFAVQPTWSNAIHGCDG